MQDGYYWVRQKKLREGFTDSLYWAKAEDWLENPDAKIEIMEKDGENWYALTCDEAVQEIHLTILGPVKPFEGSI